MNCDAPVTPHSLEQGRGWSWSFHCVRSSWNHPEQGNSSEVSRAGRWVDRSMFHNAHCRPPPTQPINVFLRDECTTHRAAHASNRRTLKRLYRSLLAWRDCDQCQTYTASTRRFVPPLAWCLWSRRGLDCWPSNSGRLPSPSATRWVCSFRRAGFCAAQAS